MSDQMFSIKSKTKQRIKQTPSHKIPTEIKAEHFVILHSEFCVLFSPLQIPKGAITCGAVIRHKGNTTSLLLKAHTQTHRGSLVRRKPNLAETVPCWGSVTPASRHHRAKLSRLSARRVFQARMAAAPQVSFVILLQQHLLSSKYASSITVLAWRPLG